MRSWIPLSLMPRKRINEPCKDQNKNGTSKFQSYSFLYYPDLHLSTGQASFWNFPATLAQSTKILMPGCIVNVTYAYRPSMLWETLFAPLVGAVNTLPASHILTDPVLGYFMTLKEEAQPAPDTTNPQLFTLAIAIGSLSFKLLKTLTSQVHPRQATIALMYPVMASLWKDLRSLGLRNKGLCWFDRQQNTVCNMRAACCWPEQGRLNGR